MNTPERERASLEAGTAFEPLLQSLSQAPATDAALRPAAASAQRLLTRVRRSAAAARALVTVRHADTPRSAPARGVQLRRLYDASRPQSLRPGEPIAVALVELAPGATWAGPDPTAQREWLVLRGALQIGATALGELDYHVVPAGMAAGALHSAHGALLYQREAAAAAPAAAGPVTRREAATEWADFGPGIRRRVMWQHQGQAALLYRTQAGAAVPRHGHGHDEECLMLEGDVFLDDVLLRPLDYQIAPAGSEHEGVYTDTGVLLFAHGDLELALKPA